MGIFNVVNDSFDKPQVGDSCAPRYATMASFILEYIYPDLDPDPDIY